MEYVEKGCCIEFKGKKYCAGGAVVTPNFICAYPAKGGVLTDWHGNALGTWKIVASWRVNSYIGSYMHQIESVVDGIKYTGRGFGIGMFYRGKRKAN